MPQSVIDSFTIDIERESETEFYAADLDEIFGIILEPGNFPPEDFTIQGELF